MFTQTTILSLLSNYASCGKLEEDFYSITPEKRLAMAEKLIDYALPKIKSIEADTPTDTETSSLTERLMSAIAKEGKSAD